LQAVIVNIVDVSYGGENGFNQVRGWQSSVNADRSTLSAQCRSRRL
jgi:peptide subunit release factor 1 (eRF1)